METIARLRFALVARVTPPPWKPPGAAQVPLRVLGKVCGCDGDRLEGVAALVAAGDA